MTDIYQSTDNSAYSFASCRYFCSNCNRQFSQIKVDQSSTTARCPRCNLYAAEVQGPQPTNQRQQQQQQQPRPQAQPQYSNQGSSQNTQNNANRSNPFSFFTSPFTSVFTQPSRNSTMEVESTPMDPLSALFGGAAFPVFTFFQTPVNEDAIIEEFLQNDPNKYGPPPASEEAIQKLQEIKFNPEGNGDKCCPVCQEDYIKDETLVKLPCGHDYHRNCVTQWLTEHNSCPMCRVQI